jgi:hypothetical protein
MGLFIYAKKRIGDVYFRWSNCTVLPLTTTRERKFRDSTDLGARPSSHIGHDL